jgi:phosphoadenosine phosphosulfate reductase
VRNVVEHSINSMRELTELSATFESKPPSASIEWAVKKHGDSLTVAASFEDAVLVDIAVSVKPDIEILFLDTQYHFAETLWYVEELRTRYDLNLKVMTPQVQPDNRWQTDLAGCCGVRKVEPLARGLAGKEAWITGLRRVDAPTRANAPIVSWDDARNMVKVNPLATWSDLDMQGYIADHDLPVHPLWERGYASIGCWPCTKPVAEGEDRRAGRWAGADKMECGLHQ